MTMETKSVNDWRDPIRAVLSSTAARLDGITGAAAARIKVGLALQEPILLQKIDDCAYDLLEAGFADEAERLFRTVVNVLASDPSGHVGLATLAMRQRRWEEAAAAWNTAIELAGYRASPHWIAQQAWSLICLGRPAAALRVLDSRAADTARIPNLLRHRLQCLVMLRRLPEARMVFAETIERHDDPATLAGLLDFAAQLFEGWARTQAFHTLLGRAQAADPLALGLRLRLLLALRNYAEFMRVYDSVADRRQLGEYESELSGVAAALRRPNVPDGLRPKIFGIGLSRTGTQSMTAALHSLGLSALHWANRLTGEIFSDDDLPLFDAFLDTPVCMSFERHYYAFPNSKFIYTIRPQQDWERSWSAYTSRWWLLSDHTEIAKVMQQPDQFQWGRRFVDIQMTLYYNHPTYVDAFRIYDSRVRRFFADKPPERYLEFDLFSGDGWDKLCSFLKLDLPGVPFPWENRAPAPRAATAPDRVQS